MIARQHPLYSACTIHIYLNKVVNVFPINSNNEAIQQVEKRKNYIENNEVVI